MFTPVTGGPEPDFGPLPPQQGSVTAPGQWRDAQGNLRDSSGILPDQSNPLNPVNLNPGSGSLFLSTDIPPGGGLESGGFQPPAGTRQIPPGIPENWRIRPTRGEGGVRFFDPRNPGNSVRIMPGNPNSPFPNSQVPYVRWQLNGQALDVNGNPVPRDTPDAHIPLQNFQFNPKLFR
jgi:hypothetical protein